MASTEEIKYQDNIAKGLQRAYDDKKTEKLDLDLDLESSKLIVFSDHHKGARDGADDFRRCERAYNAALGYYLEKGYTLFALGDVEELWECQPSSVIKSYPNTLKLESEFHKKGRYIRFWGNHDDLWGYENAVAKHLSAIYGHDLKVREALKLNVTDEGNKLGEIFLVHGHQGTTFSDQYSWFSRLVVRHVWRNWQRLTKRPSTTPATDYRLREQHDVAMYNWANSKTGLILIAGHTHRPVFRSRTHVGRIEEELINEIRATSADSERLAQLRAELEFIKAAENQRGDKSVEMSKPCYFNTGCCSFGDGDVTGIEIAGGEIKLVRWPDDNGRPLPQTLVTNSLKSVFAAVNVSQPINTPTAAPTAVT